MRELKIVLNLYKLFSSKRKKQFLLLIFLMLVSGAFDAISTVSIFPFLSILTNPEKLQQNNNFINNFFNYFEINSTNQIIALSTFAFALLVLISGSVRILNLWFNSKFAALLGSELSYEAYQKYISQGYEDHLENNTSNIISALTSEMMRTSAVIKFSLNFITAALLSILIILGSIYLYPRIILSILIIFGLIYSLINSFAKKILEENGKLITISNAYHIKVVQESINGIRNVIVDNLYEFYNKRYKEIDKTVRLLTEQNRFISAYPKYLIESIGLITIVIISFIFSYNSEGLDSLIPTLGLIALSIQKLLPSIQIMYASWSAIKERVSSVRTIINLLSKFSKNKFPEKNKRLHNLKTNISIKNLSFKYKNEKKFILKNLNLDIKKGSFIGIIGTTGSGKSTLIDLILGLLKPSKGEVIADGFDINNFYDSKNKIGLELNISHVPQSIYLSDDTILSNIALGINKNHIDKERIKVCARKAQISDFIESLPDKYLTFVGERGVRLSGGQRQRIGIARALYKKSDLIILDEATSALDYKTEEKVITSIESLKNKTTIIMIAHRLNILKKCDRVIEIVNGEIIEKDLNFN